MDVESISAAGTLGTDSRFAASASRPWVPEEPPLCSQACSLLLSPDVSMFRFLRRLPAWFQGDRGAVCLLVLIFGELTFPVLSGRAAEHWDGDMFFAPFYHHVASLIRAGTLLRWNPFCSGGSPDFAEPQVGASSACSRGRGRWAFICTG